MNRFQPMYATVSNDDAHISGANGTSLPLIDGCHVTRISASLPEYTFGAFGAGEGVPPFNPLLNNGADAICLPTM